MQLDPFQSPILFAFLFVMGWLALSALLAADSGWPKLASRFPGPQAPEGVSLAGQVLAIGKVPERNVTRLVVSPSGLHLSVLVLFRLRHAPALVPWTQVHFQSTQTTLWWRTHLLNLGNITTIRVKDRAYTLIRPYLSDAALQPQRRAAQQSDEADEAPVL